MKFFKSNKSKHDEIFENVVLNLNHLYNRKLLPLEKQYKFCEFHSSSLATGDFEAKPMILLLGQYSTGKTTFIRYLLDQDFPGIHIGPEPTTDRFIAIMYNNKEGIIPGNALVIDPKKPFLPLSKFGNKFLTRFQCSQLNNVVLESINIIDTPGILSGEKQSVERGYNFAEIIEWFAERVDRIVLLFDAHKLDISDEFRKVIYHLKGSEDKIRIVLNKSDMVNSQQLLRVYGALMWSLGKVLNTPEVARVYIGSFWDKPLHYDANRKLFELEENDLFDDLRNLPRNSVLRKLNDFIRRARLAKVHAYIISTLQAEMPTLIGKDNKKKELIQNLQTVFDKISQTHSISPGDFPNLEKMQSLLPDHDFKAFSPLKSRLIEIVDEMLCSDIPKLMDMIPKEEINQSEISQPVKGGAFELQNDNPFGVGASEGINLGKFDTNWVISKHKIEFNQIFNSLQPKNGKLSGPVVKEYMIKTKLQYKILGKIWALSDIDSDGYLDADEFSLVLYLIQLKLDGEEIPNALPVHLIPPSKKELLKSKISTNK